MIWFEYEDNSYIQVSTITHVKRSIGKEVEPSGYSPHEYASMGHVGDLDHYHKIQERYAADLARSELMPDIFIYHITTNDGRVTRSIRNPMREVQL